MIGQKKCNTLFVDSFIGLNDFESIYQNMIKIKTFSQFYVLPSCARAKEPEVTSGKFCLRFELLITPRLDDNF